jgi:hypothetical protein
MCTICNQSQPVYRCQDCIGCPVFCLDCCRNEHFRHPFHRIDHWTGHFFEPSWLWKVGIYLNLGHGGIPCPCNERFVNSDADGIPGDESGEDEDSAEGFDGWANHGRPSSAAVDGYRIIIVVHINGIHHLPIRPCLCPDAPAEDIQLLRMRFYPSTYKNIKTIFTFQLLDNYLLDNLECQTSCHHYFQKLRRMTNKAFPQVVPVSHQFHSLNN